MSELYLLIIQINLLISVSIIGLLLIRYALRLRLSNVSLYCLWSAIPLILFFYSIWPNGATSYTTTPFHSMVLKPSLDFAVISTVSFPILSWFIVIPMISLVGFQLVQLFSLYRQPTMMLINVNEKNVQVREQSSNNSPAIFGWFSPTIWLPKHFETIYSVEQQRIIILHELTHWKSRDPWSNCFAFLLLCIGWFNPLIWFAFKTFRRDQELACDERVCAKLPPRAYSNYAQLLLISATGKPDLLTAHCAQPSLTKERIMNIKKMKQSKGLPLLSLLGSVIFALSISAMSQVDSETTVSSIVNPLYPRQAAMEGVEGYVKFKFDIDASGAPQNIEIIEAQPTNTFEAEATKAFTQWRFKPEGKKGAQYTLEFKLQP